MLNPLQEVLSRSGERAENLVRPIRAGKITIAFVGQLISKAAVAALVVATTVVLTFGFPIGEMSSAGLFLGVWAGVMLASAFTILAIARRSEREGTVPSFALAVARIKPRRHLRRWFAAPRPRAAP